MMIVEEISWLCQSLVNSDLKSSHP